MKAALILTLGRVVLCPIFLVIYLYYAQLGMPLFAVPYALLVITLICELSDVFDGIIARRKKAVTELGKILDPMADSIVKMSVFLSFTQGPVHLMPNPYCAVSVQNRTVSVMSRSRADQPMVAMD